MVSILKSLASYNLAKEPETPLTMTKASEEECFKEYKKALNAVPGLNVSTDDFYLCRFLRSKSFKIPEAVKLYKSTDAWMEKNADVLSIPFSDCLPVFKNKIFTILKQRDELGRIMILVKADNWTVADISLEVIMKTLYYIIEETQLSVEDQLKGLVFILTIDGVSMTKAVEAISQFTLRNVKLLVGFTQGGSPVKVKSIYAVSTPLLAAATYTTFKFFLKKKMRNRIHVHYEGPSAIHKTISKELLPESLCGDIPEGMSEDPTLMQSLFRKHNLIYSYHHNQ